MSEGESRDTYRSVIESSFVFDRAISYTREGEAHFSLGGSNAQLVAREGGKNTYWKRIRFPKSKTDRRCCTDSNFPPLEEDYLFGVDR